MTRNSSQTVRRLVKALLLGAAMSCPGQASHAQNLVDIAAYFEQAQGARGSGLAHKTKPVDVRPATPGEVIVTMINQEKETQSPPAQTGDIVVRNRCPETGHEQILVSAASFSRRY